jgi:hypothetical protein
VLIDERAHFGRSAPSPVAKNTEAALRIFVCAAQLEVLLAQLLDLLPLLAGRQIRPQTLIGLHLAHPPTQRLRMHPEIPSDMSDRPIGFHRQTNAALDQLIRVLPRP